MQRTPFCSETTPHRDKCSVSPKATSAKRGLDERSEVWGSLKNFSPLIAFGDLSPLYEEGGFSLRRGRADDGIGPYKCSGNFAR